MFAALALFIVLLSGILAAAGISAEGEVIDSKTNGGDDADRIGSQFAGPRRPRIYADSHGQQFYRVAPLGVVLVTMLGVGCAERERILVGTAEKTVSVTPASW